MGDKLGVIARVHRTVRWIKRGFGYAGSNQTSDLGGMVFAKLARNEETRELLARDPDKLQGLVKTITRQALIGALRKRPREALPAEPTARLERVEDELDPALQREIARRQQLRLVRDELDRFLAGEGSENFRA